MDWSNFIGIYTQCSIKMMTLTTNISDKLLLCLLDNRCLSIEYTEYLLFTRFKLSVYIHTFVKMILHIFCLF